MNAQMIESRCIERPTYRRPDLLGQYRTSWIYSNLDVLHRWFHETSAASHVDDLQAGFAAFCDSQHDIECEQKEAYKAAYGSHKSNCCEGL